ncbi:hypothetical protein DC522_29770 [Microvirga sp. KLBC 81]|nr:hypothetical protein DC522_29770 [Microvirga sp. KLBC 81]
MPHLVQMQEQYKDNGSYGEVAQYYYKSGNKDRAIELVELALKSVDRPEPMQDELKQHYEPLLLQALPNYKSVKTCYGIFVRLRKQVC